MARVILLLVCLNAMGCGALLGGGTGTDRPNIVLILADDLGYGDLSCYGGEDVHTPHLDALAQRGIRFTDYHSNGVVCSPTRASLMTGRYPQRTGVEGVVTAARHREAGLPLSEVTLAEVMRDAGYATAMFGKWHLGYKPEFGPTRQGFDTFEGFVSGNIDYVSKIDQVGERDWWVGEEREHKPGYLTQVIADRAVDWIGEHKDQPFLLYLAHGAPHYPYQGPDDAGFRVPGVAQVQGPRRDLDAAYREMITAMDDSVGRVMAALEANGLTENTVVMFASDNGCTRSVGSAGPYRGSKGTVYEGGHRVPLIVSWPAKVRSATETGLPAMTMDLLPTVASITKVKLPEGVVIDGIDLTAAVLRPWAPDRWLHWAHGNQHATRHGPWKLVVRGDNLPELYHLKDDPGETADRAIDEPERVRRMLERHRQWLAESRAGVERLSKN